MNGFELHNLSTTSASQINLFSACPALWIAEKLFGHKQPQSIAALRGTLIEKAVNDIIAYGRTETDAVGDAIKEYNKATAFSHAAKVDDERNLIAPCVSLALAELAPYGEPETNPLGGQHKIEVKCNGDGFSIPVIGYLDFKFPKQGLVVDLKTSSRIPSIMPDNHQRQRAIYKQASGNMAVKFLYVSGRKAQWHEPDDHRQALQDVKNILNRQERFLRLGNKELLASVVHYDATSFYLSNAGQDIKDLFER